MKEMMIKAMVAVQCRLYHFKTKEQGAVNIVEIVVIIGIAVLLAVFFKGQITQLLNTLFGTIEESATNALGE